jgi:protein-S-isoprenylcysteine O-methyltransferase Ste14
LSAFIVALFVEMYGFPLTIYLLSGWLAQRFPGVDLLSHDAGHLWYALLGFTGDPHTNPIHLASNVLILGGLFLLASAWRVLYVAQTSGTLATTGPYRHVRHPQYLAFILIMIGFLLQWPTLVTLVMFPILVVTYVRLAHREEREVAAEFADTWRAYAAVTPRWFPRRGAGVSKGTHRAPVSVRRQRDEVSRRKRRRCCNAHHGLTFALAKGVTAARGSASRPDTASQ